MTMTIRSLLGLDCKPKPVQCSVCRADAYYADASPLLCWVHMHEWFDARNGPRSVEEYPVDILHAPPRRRRRW